jgi:hypothetical protein
MARLTGTQTTDNQTADNQTTNDIQPREVTPPEQLEGSPQADKERLKKAGIDEKKVDDSTGERLHPSQAKNRGKWDRLNPQQIMDPNVLANNAQANLLGSAAYSANPPTEIQPEEPLDRPDVKWANADKITRALRANEAGEQAEASKKKTEKSSNLVNVLLLKGYRPATHADFEIEGGNASPAAIGGKIPAGTRVKLPEQEAHRLLKLKAAEPLPAA